MVSKQFMALAVLAVMLGCTSALPRAQNDRRRRQLQLPNNNIASYPQIADLPPAVNTFLSRHVRSGAQIIKRQPQLLPISQRLPDNYTLIRPNVVDTFRCAGDEFPNGYRNYGYYADTDNECQIYHVCLPLQQLYPANFSTPITYQYSFICPNNTIFSQDALVCAWSNEAVPCEYAESLYYVNDYFFTDKGLDGKTYGKKVSTGSQGK